MKRSELLSKNLLKALSITLSASMMILNPIATLAEATEVINEGTSEDTTVTPIVETEETVAGSESITVTAPSEVSESTPVTGQNPVSTADSASVILPGTLTAPTVLGARRSPMIPLLQADGTFEAFEAAGEEQAFELFGESITRKANSASVQTFELNRTNVPVAHIAPFTAEPFGTKADAILKAFPWWLLILAVLAEETLRRLYARNRD
ncbi:MAG: hypothetical protein K6F53_06840 [Lachnospiraceae bacterium]|nr:hypothetical protein [Lachnospiraceae bacterium]